MGGTVQVSRGRLSSTGLATHLGASVEPEAQDEIVQKRTDATNAIIESAFEKKLIVAGPGTGKTFTFRRALEECGGRGLALTFIRNLVADLRAELEDIADVYTFHGFCKYQLQPPPSPRLGEGLALLPAAP